MAKKSNGEAPRINCQSCGGSGRVSLSAEMLETYEFVKLHPGCTAIDLSNKFDKAKKFHPTMFNNRLERLRESGLVRRDRDGVKWLYRTV